MAESKYTAPNDFRAFCESLGETEASLCHHGVKGMHWGERKYQDYNGRLTALGRQHYGYGAKKKVGAEEDASDKRMTEINSTYQFNKEYTLRDPIVKRAIAEAKSWDSARSNEIHINDEENRKASIKNISTGALTGAALLGGRGALAATLDVAQASNKVNMLRTIGYNAEIDPASITRSYAINAGLGVAIGAVGGAAVMGIAHGVRSVQAKRANTALERTISEIAENSNIDKKTGLKLKQNEMTMDQDMAKVNPGFKNWSDGTKSNCLICTATYALRRKGFDVTANGANDGYDATAFLQGFPKATLKHIKLDARGQDLKSAIGIPNGGYGNISVQWKNGGGHSMVVSIENDRVVIRDAQINKTYRGSAVNKLLAQTNGIGRITRLDNVDPDILQLKKLGMINPLGQSFKLEQKPTVDAAAGVSKTGGKHGDTGVLYREAQRIFHPLRDEHEIYARDRTRTERKENQKKNKYAYKNSEEKFDGGEFGLEKPIIRMSAYNLGEAKDSEHAGGNRAMYNTYYTNKNSSYVKLSFDADAESKESNRESVKQRVNDAKHVAEDEKRIVQQVPNKLQSSAIKKEYEKKYGYTQKDWNELSKSLYVNEVILGEPDSKGRVRGIVNLGTNLDANRFGGTHFDCSFVTLPNGKVIILDADPTSND